MGKATAVAYKKVMLEGMTDMGDLVLALGPELMVTGDFSDTFTGAYDIANKCVELLMLRSGMEVCCTSDSDTSLVTDYAESEASS